MNLNNPIKRTGRKGVIVTDIPEACAINGDKNLNHTRSANR